MLSNSYSEILSLAISIGYVIWSIAATGNALVRSRRSSEKGVTELVQSLTLLVRDRAKQKRS